MNQAEVYILLLNNDQYYIGASSDVENKFKEHCQGKVKSTQFKKPQKIIYRQKFSNIKLTKQTEYKLKRLKSRKIIDKIINEGNINIGLLGIGDKLE